MAAGDVTITLSYDEARTVMASLHHTERWFHGRSYDLIGQRLIARCQAIRSKILDAQAHPQSHKPRKRAS